MSERPEGRESERGPSGPHVVTVQVELRNQDDAVMATASVEVELPGADG